jgi:hypothetical protein
MIRTLRASPPGRAQRGDRKSTFNASLEQSEQLFEAAANVGVASRPILIFYGLSQAARAIAAASSVDNNSYRFNSHGIKAKGTQGVMGSGVAGVEVQAKPGAFSQVSTILGSAQSQNNVSLGDIWGLLPEAERFPLVNMGSLSPVVASPADPHLVRVQNAIINIFGLPVTLGYRLDLDTSVPHDDVAGYREETAKIRAYLDQFPALKDLSFYHGVDNVQVRYHGRDALSFLMTCENRNYAPEKEILTSRVVCYRGLDLAFPSVPGNEVGGAYHPFMIWWAILYCLSMLARYEPNSWIKIIDVSASQDAVAVENILKEALAAIPELIHRTIVQVSN